VIYQETDAWLNLLGNDSDDKIDAFLDHLHKWKRSPS